VKALKIQGLAFSTAALVVSALSLVFVHPDARTELIVLGVLILLLGVPHGAFDTIFAWRLYGIGSLVGWIGFVIVYLLLAAGVVAVWVVAPAVFLLGFLLISTVHFSGDPTEGTPLLTRLLYGGSILVLPSLFHADEMGRLFGLLVGPGTACMVMPLIRLLAWVWLPCVGLAVILRSRSDLLGAVEIGAASLLALVAPPLVSFTLFFCGMHSARHILRTIDYSGRTSTRVLLLAALLPMAGVMASSAVAWHFLKDAPMEARVVQIIFVGLAALTVPHMILVERVRLSGWLKGSCKE
jgi:Brp/Blh family beta-carotene 15,15'-monooxygenase